MRRALTTQAMLQPRILCLLAAAILPACASSQPRPVASHTSTLNAQTREARNLVTMSDKDIKAQSAGTNSCGRAAESQSVMKRGKIEKDNSEITELVETDISTVVETTSIPISDQDVR